MDEIQRLAQDESDDKYILERSKMSLVPYDATKFAVLSPDSEEMLQNIKTNIGGESIQMSQLERLKIPAAGATTWEVPDMMGAISTKNLKGIVIFHQGTRIFWRDAYTGARKRPDCWSPDAITGIGDPGGDCNSCPFAEWGSARNGRGQACSLKRNVFILREEEMLPLVLTLPPTSLREFNSLMMRLASRGVPYYGVVIDFSLKKVERDGVPAYAQAQFGVVSQLDRQHVNRMAEYHEVMVPILRARSQRMQEQENEELEDSPL